MPPPPSARGPAPEDPRSPSDATRLVELFGELAALPPAEREDSLERIARADPERADELRALLEHHDRAGGFLDPEAESPAVPPGWGVATIPGFRVLEELGVGTTGVVYRALQTEPEREVALKVLRWDSRDERTVARFRREGRLLGRLRHRHLAQVHALGVVDLAGRPLPWIAMELVDGAPFDAACAGEDWRATVARAADAADALGAAHRAGIVHRDLKPANVLVETGGRTVVLDFGIARELVEDDLRSLRTASGQVLGTLAYMAPEQAQGRSRAIGPPSDVYALGAMLHEALTGSLPVDVRALETTVALQAIARGTRPRLRRERPDLPRDLELIVQRALELDPDRRYADGAALAADLRRLLAAQPIEARPARALYRASLFLRRNRLAVGSVGAVVLALLLGLAVALSALARTREAEARAQRTADLLLAQDLERRAKALWPALPDQVPELERWVAEARTLRARLGDDLEAWPPSGIGPAESGAERDPRTIAADLFDPDRVHGGERDVLGRLERARQVAGGTVGAHPEAWAGVLRRTRASAAYEQLEFEPQVGLVPLGPDPASGLEEFALWGVTGRTPARDANGRLDLAPDSAIVLVLLPGGRFRAGAQSEDPDGPRYDPRASTRHEWLGDDFFFDLDPFFCGKYELTHHQFRGATGYDPSFWQPGEFELAERVPISERAPVETITQPEAAAFCRRLALELPTEVQHEYATRAGTETPYWTGADWRSAVGRVALRSLQGPRPYVDDDGVERVWDSYAFLAPTGIHDPNPFGLHDMAGNAREWTREVFWVDRDPAGLDPRTGEPRVPRADPFGNHHGVRGSGYSGDPREVLRSSIRRDTLGLTTDNQIGLRVVRRIAGPWTRHARPLDDPRRVAPR